MHHFTKSAAVAFSGRTGRLTGSNFGFWGCTGVGTYTVFGRIEQPVTSIPIIKKKIQNIITNIITFMMSFILIPLKFFLFLPIRMPPQPEVELQLA